MRPCSDEDREIGKPVGMTVAGNKGNFAGCRLSN